MKYENTGWQATCKKDSDDKDFTGLFAVQRYHYPSLLALFLFIVIVLSEAVRETVPDLGELALSCSISYSISLY